MDVRNLLVFAASAAALSLGGPSAAAQERELTYSQGEYESDYGTGGVNAETYDVAFHLQDKSLTGAFVKGVRIIFPSTEKLSNAKAWLSAELPAIKSSKAGDPDIASKDFDVSGEWTEVIFDTPYQLTDGGVYVGYSFDVEKSATALKPVAVTRYTSPEGHFIHTTKVFRTSWRNLYQAAGDLAIQVILASDDFKENAVSVSYIPDINAQTGTTTPASFEIVNHGTRGVQSIDYELQIDGQTVAAHSDVTLPANYGVWGDISTILPAVSTKGSHPLTVTVTRVNGFANEDAAPARSTSVDVYNTLPIHRTVLEEYTGTWCGYCPRGFVGLEEMNRLYPADFIGISYHNGDPMEIMSSNDYPWNNKVLGTFQGFPSAALDRVRATDAYCGDGEYGLFGIDKAWISQRETFAPAAIDVETNWKDDNTLAATAHVTFPIGREDNPYLLSFVLTADGLSGEGGLWVQSNYYSGETGWPSSMDQFTAPNTKKVEGLVFNDVIVAIAGKDGIEGSLTAPIVEDVAQSFTQEFRLDEVVNTSGASLVQDKSKLRVNALLIDTSTGFIINANKAWAGKSSTDGIGHIASSSEEVVTHVAYYDMTGRRVTMPGKGLYIKAETLRNGHVRTQKVRF